MQNKRARLNNLLASQVVLKKFDWNCANPIKGNPGNVKSLVSCCIDYMISSKFQSDRAQSRLTKLPDGTQKIIHQQIKTPITQAEQAEQKPEPQKNERIRRPDGKFTKINKKKNRAYSMMKAEEAGTDIHEKIVGTSTQEKNESVEEPTPESAVQAVSNNEKSRRKRQDSMIFERKSKRRDALPERVAIPDQPTETIRKSKRKIVIPRRYIEESESLSENESEVEVKSMKKRKSEIENVEKMKTSMETDYIKILPENADITQLQPKSRTSMKLSEFFDFLKTKSPHKTTNHNTENF